MKQTERNYFLMNLILLILAISCLFYYNYEGGLWLKGVTSSWFLILGIVNLIFAFVMKHRKKSFIFLIVIGLLSTLAADIMLGIHFVLGVALFALGHIFYFAAYCILEKFRVKDLIFILIIGVISLFLVFGTPFIQLEDPSLKYLLTAYAIIISAMLGKATANLFAKKIQTRWLFFIASALFWFSDVMLAFNMFGNGGSLASDLCLFTYWPGQYLLGHSLYYFIMKRD